MSRSAGCAFLGFRVRADLGRRGGGQARAPGLPTAHDRPRPGAQPPKAPAPPASLARPVGSGLGAFPRS